MSGPLINLEQYRLIKPAKKDKQLANVLDAASQWLMQQHPTLTMAHF